MLLVPGVFSNIGEPLTNGLINSQNLLDIFFKYYLEQDGNLIAVKKSLRKIQLIFINSIQEIYKSQNVKINIKHIEILVRQMTMFILILDGGNTPFLKGDCINYILMTELYIILKEYSHKLNLTQQITFTLPLYKPLLKSATTASLTQTSFLSNAGFQETRSVLTKASIEGTTDWLKGLKESVIIGRSIPAGSNSLIYKNYLDNIYLFKITKESQNI